MVVITIIIIFIIIDIYFSIIVYHLRHDPAKRPQAALGLVDVSPLRLLQRLRVGLRDERRAETEARAQR